MDVEWSLLVEVKGVVGMCAFVPVYLGNVECGSRALWHLT